ncbi:DUF423 domain-containing protein [Formosa sp. S-31]|uniref:DUF423 domain-containing protein n=1 Tax=Formosa sp. S-31 TaxID=2790949 RepID=UPI003EBDABEE
MENWNFKIKKRPKEIIERLKSELNSIGGFVFDEKKPTTFSFRKRILYPFYMVFQNWTIVNGKLLNDNVENDTNMEISFNQHFLIRLILFIHIIFGLGLVFGLFLTTKNYIFGGLIIALGIVLWIAANRKFKKDTEKYKTLITEILDL